MHKVLTSLKSMDSRIEDLSFPSYISDIHEKKPQGGFECKQSSLLPPNLDPINHSVNSTRCMVAGLDESDIGEHLLSEMRGFETKTYQLGKASSCCCPPMMELTLETDAAILTGYVEGRGFGVQKRVVRYDEMSPVQEIKEYACCGCLCEKHGFAVTPLTGSRPVFVSGTTLKGSGKLTPKELTERIVSDLRPRIRDRKDGLGRRLNVLERKLDAMLSTTGNRKIGSNQLFQPGMH